MGVSHGKVTKSPLLNFNLISTLQTLENKCIHLYTVMFWSLTVVYNILQVESSNSASVPELERQIDKLTKVGPPNLKDDKKYYTDI